MPAHDPGIAPARQRHHQRDGTDVSGVAVAWRSSTRPPARTPGPRSAPTPLALQLRAGTPPAWPTAPTTCARRATDTLGKRPTSAVVASRVVDNARPTARPTSRPPTAASPADWTPNDASPSPTRRRCSSPRSSPAGPAARPRSGPRDRQRHRGLPGLLRRGEHRRGSTCTRLRARRWRATANHVGAAGACFNATIAQAGVDHHGHARHGDLRHVSHRPTASTRWCGSPPPRPPTPAGQARAGGRRPPSPGRRTSTSRWPACRRISSGGVLALALNALLALTALGIAFARARRRRPPGAAARGRRRLAGADQLQGGRRRSSPPARCAPASRPAAPCRSPTPARVAGALAVARTAAPSSTPGPAAACCRARLELHVFDVTNASAARAAVVRHARADAPARRRGAAAPASSGPTGSWPRCRAATADNAFQGAALSRRLHVDRRRDRRRHGDADRDAHGHATTPTATPEPDRYRPAPTRRPARDPQAAQPTRPRDGRRHRRRRRRPDGRGARLAAVRRSRGAQVRQPAQVRDPHPPPARDDFKSIKVTVNGKTKLQLKGLKAQKVKTTVSLQRPPQPARSS